MMVCTWTDTFQGTHTATNQPRVCQIQKKLLWKTKWHSKPEILTSIRFYPSFLQLFCFFPFFFFPTSFSLFFLKNRAPTFLLLPAFGFLLIPIFLLVPFPWNHPWTSMMHSQISKHLKNQKKQTCSCSRCYNHWIIDHYSDHMNCKTIQPKQCTMHNISRVANFQPFPSNSARLLPPPLCEQVGPSVGPSFGPVCHRSWYQMLLCTTLKLCHIWIYHQYITFTS